jgi:CRISPR/Cas system CSM-associated protein Csm3 (group 7 of RAMP superfamily)
MNRIDKSRKIIERIIVEGDLVLLTPTSLGNGDSDGLTDMSLLYDEVEERALLTGTSIAGALRNYLQECENGYEKAEDKNSITRKLFGYHEDEYAQSCLIIDDAFSSEKPTTELRDGVRIESATRTAADKAKYDFELLEAGTMFKLRFELLICQGQERDSLVSAFASALQGFEKGEIHIGAKKRRGYGECQVENWKYQSFDLTTKDGLLAWLKHDTDCLNVTDNISISTLITQRFDERNYFQIDATFALDGSILIRSGSKISDKYQPDDVHLRSKRNGAYKPILSGTSLAGVLRHRAEKICNTLKDGSGKSFVEKIFGDDDTKKKDKSASRLEVRETEIKNTNDLVQTRVKIDRFTGGAMDTALFDAAPVFSDGNEKAVNISLRLRNPKDAEIGLLLLLLKDLWTSDLPVGGESSIGRGRLKGISAFLNYRGNSDVWAICLSQNVNGQIDISGSKDRDFLNKLVSEHLKNAL